MDRNSEPDEASPQSHTQFQNSGNLKLLEPQRPVQTSIEVASEASRMAPTKSCYVP